MIWGIFRFWPLVLPIAIGIFVFVADEPLWKKIGLILLSVIIITIGYVSTNIHLTTLCHFTPIILLIVLLIYCRNRGVL